MVFIGGILYVVQSTPYQSGATRELTLSSLRLYHNYIFCQVVTKTPYENYRGFVLMSINPYQLDVAICKTKFCILTYNWEDSLSAKI